MTDDTLSANVSDTQTGKRIDFPEPQTMTPAQKEVYDQIVSGPRKTLVGPLRAALHNPILADRWQRFGQVVRFETSIPTRLSELAILVTARRWSSDLEWAIHLRDAKKAGLDVSWADAIRHCNAPDFGADEDARHIYNYAQQIVQNGDVDDATYAAVRDRWSPAGVVELTAIIGYYSMVAMTLNVHRVPLPEGVTDTLPGAKSTLSTLPAAPAR